MISDIIPPRITVDMINLFIVRTSKHIRLVQKYTKILEDKLPELKGLSEKSKIHDASKYDPEELKICIRATWFTKLTKQVIPKDVLGSSWEHHKKINDHHPEYWDDVKKMPDLDIAHAICDWAAISEENNTSLKEWINTKGMVQWDWSPEQIKLIYQFAEATGRE